MKVFIDTNVILEYFMHREKYEVTVGQVHRHFVSKNIDFFEI